MLQSRRTVYQNVRNRKMPTASWESPSQHLLQVDAGPLRKRPELVEVVINISLPAALRSILPGRLMALKTRTLI